MTFPAIPLHRFAVLGSTSDWAKEALQGGAMAVPFAVTAERQTQGRGRLGRTWQSPEGNLFLSLALPVPPAVAATRQYGLLPLAAGLVVARWLDGSWGLRPILKWPNDLLVAGRKLAGILCESIVSGPDVNHVVVGIGVNVAACPDFGAGWDYRAVALATLLGEATPSAGEAAENLTAAFGAAWATLTPAEILADARRWGLPQGSPLWRDGEGQRVKAFAEGLADDGSFLARVVGEGRVARDASVEAGWRWAYQDRNGHGPPLAVADVGNTRLKVAVWRDARKATHDVEAFPYDAAGRADLRAYLAKSLAVPMAEYGRWPLYVGSVHPGHAEALDEALAESPFFPLPLAKRWVGVRWSRYDVGAIGIDRMAALEGAAARPWGENESARLVVSLGTAVTVDVLGRRDGHWGGFIWPGIKSQYQAMHRDTGALPLITQAPHAESLPRGLAEKHAWPQDTWGAMGDGVVWQVAKALEGIVADVSRDLPGETTLWLCGGDAPLVASLLPASTLAPHLVLEGLRLMALGGQAGD